jgi:L-fuconolactonase
MFVTDSQVHIWEPERPERPWPSGGFIPAWASTPVSAESLIDQMDEANVARAFLVPPAFDGGRNDYCLDSAARFPDRFVVMGRIPLDGPDGPEMMEAFAEEQHGAGLRFSFFMPEHRALLEAGHADWMWPLAEKLNLPLMVYPAADLVDYIGSIAQQHDSLRITIDHMALGHTADERDDYAFRNLENLLALATLPNVAVKVSALPEYSTQPYPYRNLHPYVRQTVDAFGPERVFWGTDLMRLPCTYREAVTMFTDEMQWLDAEELDLVMGRAACDWHGWKPPEVPVHSSL